MLFWTKMENFAGSRKVAHILKVWPLLSTKIPISSKSFENSSVMTHSAAAPPVYANPKQKFFLRHRLFSIYSIVCIVTFQKSNIYVQTNCWEIRWESIQIRSNRMTLAMSVPNPKIQWIKITSLSVFRQNSCVLLKSFFRK